LHACGGLFFIWMICSLPMSHFGQDLRGFSQKLLEKHVSSLHMFAFRQASAGLRVPDASSFKGFPCAVVSSLLTVLGLLAALHAWIGWQLLPALTTHAAGSRWVQRCCCCPSC
jgi:hypothetical protein